MQEQHVCTDHVWLLFFDDLNFAAGTLMDSSQLFIGWAAKVCQHQVCPHNTVFRQMFHESSLGTQIEMLPLYLYKKIYEFNPRSYNYSVGRNYRGNLVKSVIHVSRGH